MLGPRDDEVAGFTHLTTVAYAGDRHDGVIGCIADDVTQARECGVIVLDTGAPGIRVVGGATAPRAWPAGSAATLTFAGGGGPAAPLVERFTVGHGVATRMTFARSEARQTVIYVGPIPYFVFSVLYDPAARTIGLRPRGPSP